MGSESERSARHWDEFATRFSGGSIGAFWWEIPAVMQEMNRRISGDAGVDWISYTVERYLQPLPVERCLSLGCGTGALERRLARLGAFRRCEGIDFSPASIEAARTAARAESIENLEYRVEDINTARLSPAAYDVVWIYGALHHFQELEHVLEQIRLCLKPGGLLVLNEYVGPARFQFPARQKEIVDLCLKLLPRRYRVLSPDMVELEREKETSRSARRRSSWASRLRRLLSRRAEMAPPKPQVRESAGFPEVQDVVDEDPSEAARSHQILSSIESRFTLAERTDWGGNIPQFLFSGIAGNFPAGDPCAEALVRMIWQIEQTLLECGELRSDFCYLVAKPRASGSESA